MTPEEKIRIEHRLTEVEARAQSNTKRLNEHDEILQQDQELISAVKELAVETKYMREDLNKITSRVDKIENKDGDAWNNFRWIVITAVVGVVIGFIAASLGLQ